MNKPKIGITVGDINGIGLEVILKSLRHETLLNQCIPVIYGSSKVVSYHKNIVGDDLRYHVVRSTDQVQEGEINVVNCWQESVNISLGKPTRESGSYAFRSLEYATSELKAGLIDALVTAPIHKQAMNLSDFPFPGHTEFLAKELGSGENLMFMVSEEIKVGLVTNHLPIDRVTETITPELVRRKIEMMLQSLTVDFGLEKPILAVLGLNPHAGDGGVIGTEDQEIVYPVISEFKEAGHMVMGPFPADGFFGSGIYRKFDAILAMYHDQGLIPFKTLSFGKGVNFTAGLPMVRTSPDHGTAYDKAGKNEADPSSFMQAIFTAIDITRRRADYREMHADQVKKDDSLAGQEDEILEEEEGNS